MDEDCDIDAAYTNGSRRGMFDKCNGLPERNFNGVETTVYNRIYIDGYDDAYAANEVQI